jgi:hypothetical protein
MKNNLNDEIDHRIVLVSLPLILTIIVVVQLSADVMQDVLTLVMIIIIIAAIRVIYTGNCGVVSPNETRVN